MQVKRYKTGKKNARRYKIPKQVGSHEESKKKVDPLQYNLARELAVQPVILYSEAEVSGHPFSYIRQDGLWAEPAAPDPAEHDCDKKEAESKNQGGQEDKVEFLDPQDMAEQVEIEAGYVDAQQALAVNFKPWKEQKQKGGRPLNYATLRTYELFILHEKTGREISRPAPYFLVL